MEYIGRSFFSCRFIVYFLVLLGWTPRCPSAWHFAYRGKGVIFNIYFRSYLGEE